MYHYHNQDLSMYLYIIEKLQH